MPVTHYVPVVPGSGGRHRAPRPSLRHRLARLIPTLPGRTLP